MKSLGLISLDNTWACVIELNSWVFDFWSLSNNNWNKWSCDNDFFLYNNFFDPKLSNSMKPNSKTFRPGTGIVDGVGFFQKSKVRLKGQQLENMFFIELQQGSDFANIKPVSRLILHKSFDDLSQEMTIPIFESLQLIAQLCPAEGKSCQIVKLIVKLFQVTDGQDCQANTEWICFVNVNLRVWIAFLQGFKLLWRYDSKTFYLRRLFPSISGLFKNPWVRSVR